MYVQESAAPADGIFAWEKASGGVLRRPVEAFLQPLDFGCLWWQWTSANQRGGVREAPPSVCQVSFSVSSLGLLACWPADDGAPLADKVQKVLGSVLKTKTLAGQAGRPREHANTSPVTCISLLSIQCSPTLAIRMCVSLCPAVSSDAHSKRPLSACGAMA